MGSSRPIDRSIGEATFLPQWMKGKMETRFDYSDSTFSPPADDDFFFIHYNKHQEALKSSSNNNNNNNGKDGFRPINEVLANKSENSGSNFEDSTKSLDFSKHTLPCQSYIPLMSEKVNEPKIILPNKSKHQVNEDEFRNTKSAECGRSIVSVASQIMSSKFGKANSSDSSSSSQHQSNEIAQRKGSKSLPATPLTSPSITPEGSPKSRRRVYGNRYFTGAFVSDGPERPRNGWLLGSILGQSRDLITPKIEEEEEHQIDQVPSHALGRKKSISSHDLTYFGKNDNNSDNNNKIQANIIQVNPTEFREMNFWTPTSM